MWEGVAHSGCLIRISGVWLNIGSAERPLLLPQSKNGEATSVRHD